MADVIYTKALSNTTNIILVYFAMYCIGSKLSDTKYRKDEDMLKIQCQFVCYFGLSLKLHKP